MENDPYFRSHVGKMSLQIEVAEIREDCMDMASDLGWTRGKDGIPLFTLPVLLRRRSL